MPIPAPSGGFRNKRSKEFARTLLERTARGAVQDARKHDIINGVERRKQVVLLEYHADSLATVQGQFPLIHLIDARASNFDLASIRAIKSS